MQNDLAHGAAQSGADRAAGRVSSRRGRARASARMESAQLRSPIDGSRGRRLICRTSAGKHLDAGTAFRAGAGSLIGNGAGCRFRNAIRRCEHRRECSDQAGQLSAAHLARTDLGCQSRGEGGRRRTHVHGGSTALKCGCKFTRRDDWPGEGLSWMGTGRVCSAATSCAVDHGRHFGIGLGGNGNDNAFRCLDSLLPVHCSSAVNC